MQRDVLASDQNSDDVDLGFIASEIFSTAEDLSCPSLSNMLEYLIDQWPERDAAD